MLDRIRKKFRKEETITLWELYNMAKEAGLEVNGLSSYVLNSNYYYSHNNNGCYYHFIDNDHNVIHEGSYFEVEEVTKNPNNPVQKFVYYVGMTECSYCNQMKLKRYFNQKYGVCDECFKTLKKDWNKRESSLEDYIDSQKVLKTLSNT